MGAEERKPVDVFEGQLDRRIFADEEVYKQELEQVFSRAWLFIGHDSLIPSPNDFFLSSMGQDPVLLTRDTQGLPHAFLNLCPHGGPIARAEEGSAEAFRCAHGWVFRSDGTLVSVPGLPELDIPRLPKEQRSLIRVGKLAFHAGFIFATWDAKAPSLERYLGDMRWYLDTLVDRREGGIELLGPIKWSSPFNWKIPADNFMGGQFYASILKPDPDGAQLLPALADEDPHSRKGYEASVANGHGIGMRLAEDQGEYRELLRLYRSPALLGYEQSIRPEMEERLGSVRAQKLFPHNATIFPNVSFLWDCPSLHIWHPRGPNETEVWTFAIVDKAAPESVRASIRQSVVNLAGPSGILEREAVDNWVFASRSGKSVVGGGYEMDISMGLGHEQPHPVLPGLVVPRFYSEVAQRGMYQFWAEMMQAKSWREVPVAPLTRGARGKRTTRKTTRR